MNEKSISPSTLIVIGFMLLTIIILFSYNKFFRDSITVEDYNLEQEVIKDYPLAEKLPYSTDDYSVKYMQANTLLIDVYNADLSDVEVISMVQDWVNQQGLNPQSHEYVTLRPKKE